MKGTPHWRNKIKKHKLQNRSSEEQRFIPEGNKIHHTDMADVMWRRPPKARKRRGCGYTGHDRRCECDKGAA